jgi:23S rRNA pseudouridine2605 synthase
MQNTKHIERPSGQMRLQKYMAHCGVASRRKAEELILGGRVKVDGVVVRELGSKIDPKKNLVEFNGKVISSQDQTPLYIVFHKPRSVISSVHDPVGRPTVLDYFKGISERIYPIGRLDYLSEGLMILTNDGELTHQLLHPKFNIEKVYEVKVFGLVSESILKRLREGVYHNGEKLCPKNVRILKFLKGKTWLEFRLVEGKNREIRRLCEALGLTIDKLKRVAIGGLSLQGVAPGNSQFVSKRSLLRSIGLDINFRKLVDAQPYFSKQKSLTLNKRRKRTMDDERLADNSKYTKFRKDRYYDYLKSIKESGPKETK